MVVCPSGCGGTRKHQSAVGRGRVDLREKTEPRTRIKLTDEAIERALTDASSVTEAMVKLDIRDNRTITERCKKVPRLMSLYQAAKTRGLANSRRHNRSGPW